MSKPINEKNTGDLAKHSLSSTDRVSSLSYQGIYTCPVCRHGEISALSLMDAFACNFCRHIFTANLEKQWLKMADSSLPLTWYWNGRSWLSLPRAGAELGWGAGLAAIVFVILPPALVGLSAYLFPPLPNEPLSWFPTFWTGLTFFSHLACVIWLMIEYYQFPVFAFLRVWRQHLLGRRQ